MGLNRFFVDGRKVTIVQLRHGICFDVFHDLREIPGATNNNGSAKRHTIETMLLLSDWSKYD